MKISENSSNPKERDLFIKVLEKATPEERASFLQEACGNSPELRARIELLLERFEQTGTFLEKPAVSAEQRNIETAIASPQEPTVLMTATERHGERIGRYKLLQKIGEGGCGTVYMAEQEEPVRRRVALKVVKLGMDTQSVIARFEAERQALALMDHPNIAKLYDAGVTGSSESQISNLKSQIHRGRPYFVMELVRGVWMTAYCDENNLSTRERLELFAQVCRAIQHAHQKGIIHRDIKPSNILVTVNDGVPVPKVIDFGIAKATQGPLTEKTLFTAFEQFLGTPAYMSPEQAAMTSLDIDTRSDIYSLGVLLYELLTGRTPFDAKELLAAGVDEMRRMIREKEPARPSTRLSTLIDAELSTTAKRRRTDSPKLLHLIKGDLDWIVMKALEKDRARRYETANGLAADVDHFLNDQPVLARPPSNLYQFQKLVRRNKLGFAAAGAVVSMLLFSAVVSTWQASRATRALHESERQTERARQAERKQSLLRQEANSALSQLSETLQTSDLQRADQLFNEKNYGDGLAYLSRVLRQNPGNLVAAGRALSILSQVPIGVPELEIRHGSAIQFVQYSSEGKHLLTVDNEGVTRVWEAANGELIQMIKPASSFPFNWNKMWPHFSSDGKYVLSPFENRAGIWEVSSGKPFGVPITHEKQVRYVIMSADSDRVLSISDDMEAKLSDPRTGATIAQVSEAREESDFDPQGKRVAIMSGDLVRVLDSTTGRDVLPPLKHESAVYWVEFDRRGRRLLATCPNSIRLWDIESGQLLGRLSGDPGVVKAGRQSFGVAWAHFSPEGLRAMTCSDGFINILEVATNRYDWMETGFGKVEAELRVPAEKSQLLRCAQFSPDGRLGILAAKPDALTIWNAESRAVETIMLPNNAPVTATSFHPDGQHLLTGSVDGTVRVWRLPNTRNLPMSRETRAYWREAKFLTEDQVLLFGADAVVERWGTRTGKLLESRPELALAASLDGKWSLCLSNTGPVNEVLLKGYIQGTNGERHLKPSHPVLAAQFSADASKLSLAGETNMSVWATATGKLLWTVAGNLFKPDGFSVINRVQRVQFNSAGNLVVIAWMAQKVGIYDGDNGRELQALKHNALVVNALFSPDGSRVLTVYDDEPSRGDSGRSVRLWDVRTGGILSDRIKLEHPITSVDFSPDGERFITCSGDQAIIWNRENSQAATKPLPHKSTVVKAKFSPDGSRIVTVGRDDTWRVWDAHSGFPISEPQKEQGLSTRFFARADPERGFEIAHSFGGGEADLSGYVFDPAFSPNGSQLLTGAFSAHVWELPRPELPAASWVASAIETLGGKRLAPNGNLEGVLFQEFSDLKRSIFQSSSSDAFTTCFKWLFTSSELRTISPFARRTTQDHVSHLLEPPGHLPPESKWKTLERLGEAARLSPTNGLPFVRLAQAGIVQARAGNRALNLVETGVADFQSRRALDFDPDNPEVWRARAEVLALSGRTDEANVFVTKLLDRRPDMPSAWNLKGMILESQNRLQFALEALTKALELAESTRPEPNASLDRILLDRSRVLLKLNRKTEGIADFTRAKQIPPRIVNAAPALIDLSDSFNAGLREDWLENWLQTPKGWLADVPVGSQVLGGVQFDVRGVIQLSGKRLKELAPGFPEQIAGIKVAQKCRKLHFLHAAFWHETNGCVIGQYVVHFANGRHEEQPITYGLHLREYKAYSDRSEPNRSPRIAWEGEGSLKKRLFISTWENPMPEVPIETVDFKSSMSQSAPFLLAITAEP